MHRVWLVTCRWQRWSVEFWGKRGKREITSAATAGGDVEKVRVPPPRNRNPMPMLMAMWLP